VPHVRLWPSRTKGVVRDGLSRTEVTLANVYAGSSDWTPSLAFPLQEMVPVSCRLILLRTGTSHTVN